MSELKHEPNEPLRFRTEPPGESEQCRVLVLFPGEDGEMAIRVDGLGRVALTSRGFVSAQRKAGNVLALAQQVPGEDGPKSAVSYDKT